jgi:mRNA interferase RelE/StbE
MTYSIEFRPVVLKSLKRFPKKDLVQIKKKVEELGQNLPAPNITKMKGNNSFHKVRTGNYRIIYEIHESRVVILIVKIGHRKDVYKSL